MTETITLAAEPRDRAGKGVARATRRAGRVPAVIYGGGEPPLLISLDARSTQRHVALASFFTHTYEVAIGGQSHHVLPRDVQLHPVTDLPIHIDFLRVGADTAIVVEVPVHFVGQDKAPGIKRGGMLNVVRHSIEVRCPANSIPEHIEVDLAGREIGDSVHISAVTLPEGVKPTIDRDFTIATIAAPSALRGKEDQAAAATPAETPAAS